jgi:hypothetical membrane protein
MPKVKNRRLNPSFLTAGIAGIVVFLTAAAYDSLARADYDPVVNYLSMLTLGEYGIWQRFNFAILGLSLISVSIGIRKIRKLQTSSKLFLIAGIAQIFVGVFLVEDIPFGPVFSTASMIHVLHLASASIVALLIPMSALASLSYIRKTKRVSLFMTTFIYGFIVLLSSLFLIGSRFHLPVYEMIWPIKGLIQRSLILASLAWIVLFCLHIMRRQR